MSRLAVKRSYHSRMPLRRFRWYHLLLAWLVFVTEAAAALRASLDVRRSSGHGVSIVAVHVPVWLVTMDLILLAMLIAVTVEWVRSKPG
jgi:hypothetical protein